MVINKGCIYLTACFCFAGARTTSSTRRVKLAKVSRGRPQTHRRQRESAAQRWRFKLWKRGNVPSDFPPLLAHCSLQDGIYKPPDGHIERQEYWPAWLLLWVHSTQPVLLIKSICKAISANLNYLLAFTCNRRRINAVGQSGLTAYDWFLPCSFTAYFNIDAAPQTLMGKHKFICGQSLRGNFRFFSFFHKLWMAAVLSQQPRKKWGVK